ncbi:MAG: TonB-dependent receptor, partial [Acidobacteriota bacterium]|nr:TonB-dependent receptor [Acidobacteriota bacterium]
MNRTVLTPIYKLMGAGGRTKLRRRCSSLIVLSLALFMFHFSSSSATAQTTTSTIEGTVADANGAVIAGAEVKASGTTLAAERNVTTDTEGFYRLAALPAGTYTITISQAGFAPSVSNIELTLNRTVTFDIQLQVGDAVREVVNINQDALPLLEPNASSTGLTVTPRQITELPVNGRDYLDLLQLVPGVAINRQADPDSDEATPVLGERGGNNNFFIDGHPNKDTVNGGPAAQFNQETIAEFQVLTTGYKAEFGQASGGIINVITKSGGNGFHGVGSLFLRNEALDKSNSLD